jgi:hypothetical protein
MKKIAILFTFCFCFVSAFSQQKTPSFKVKGIKAYLGGSWDKYQNMSLEWMQMRTNNQSVFNQDLSQKEESIYFSSGGVQNGAQIILTPTDDNKLSNIGKPELRLGIQSVMGKEALVEYYDRSTQNVTAQEDIMYCFVENEVRTSAEILWAFGEDRYRFYTGLGSNISGSFGNDLFIFTNFSNARDWSGNNFMEADISADQVVTDGKSVVYSRFYVPMSASMLLLNRFEVSATYAFGVGVEKVIQGDANTFRTGQFTIGLQYNFHQNKNSRF